MIQAGDKAPSVRGVAYDGTTIDLGAPGKPTVLYFYPKASTSGWTTEAVEFNGLLGEFAALGLQVVGASVDKPVANERFAGKYSLGFPLVSDPDREVTQAFEVGGLVGGAKRSTLLIDADGTVRRVYDKVKAKGHAAQVLDDARAIWG